MISYDEFAAGMKNIAQFSKETTKRLFAYMDRNQIGLVDFNNFIKVMKKSVLDNLEERAEDNFDWQVDIIKQIQKWYYSANISSEDAFRIVDTDYDQQIGKNDLRIFLQSILFIPAEEVTSVRIDRLFNLIDQYKKGRIGYEDFRRILTEDFRPTDNFSLTGGAPVDKHSFDWKLNARQKMGIYISRKYKSLDDSFEEISHHGARITFEQFNNWIFTHSVLDGFNLTEKLLKDLFSDFDPHKKGHLTRSDWQSVFGNLLG
jgi:Ca2+-binding EF-hand superfamily protein